jgi:hypothetical protein
MAFIQAELLKCRSKPKRLSMTPSEAGPLVSTPKSWIQQSSPGADSEQATRRHQQESELLSAFQCSD